MANLGHKNGVYHIRFRFQGKEYKKSLKTADADSAQAAKRSVELTIHRILLSSALSLFTPVPSHIGFLIVRMCRSPTDRSALSYFSTLREFLNKPNREEAYRLLWNRADLHTEGFRVGRPRPRSAGTDWSATPERS